MTPTLDLRAGMWIPWVRVSDIKQEVERQYGLIEAIKTQNNLHDRVLPTVELRHVSGRWVMADEDVKRVLEDLKNPKILGVILSDQDRLFRMGRFGSIGILDHFVDYEKLILTPEGLIDLDSDSGFMSAAMKGVVSGIDWRKIRRLCNEGKEVKRKQGIHPNGAHTIALGVLVEKVRNASNRVVSCTWSYDPEYGERMRMAYQYLLNDPAMSYSEILRRVGGYTHPGGLIKSLGNPIWKGFQRYPNKATGPEYPPDPKQKPLQPYTWRGRLIVPDPTKKVKMKRKQLPRKDGGLLERIDALADNPVVSEENWDRVQKTIERRKLRRRRIRRKNKSGESDFLFMGDDVSGIPKCKRCGRAIYGKRGSHGHGGDVYVCNFWSDKKTKSCGLSRNKRVAFDEAVRSMLTGRQLIEEVVRAVVAQAETSKSLQSPEPRGNEKEKWEIEQRQARYFDQYRKKKITLDEFNTHLSEIEAALRILDAAPVPAPAPTIYDAERLVVALAGAFHNLRRYDIKKQRKVVWAVIREILIDGHTISGVTLHAGFLRDCAMVIPEQNTKERGTLLTRPQSTLRSDKQRDCDLIVNFNKPIEIARYVQ